MRKHLATLLALIILGGGGVTARGATREKMNQHPTLDALEAEAQKIRAARPGQWEKWGEEADKFYEDFASKTFPWLNRGAPPLPEFKTLNFPLAFLAAQLRQLHSAEGRDAQFRFRGYLEAVVTHTDPRRARFLEEYGELYREGISRDESRWDRMLTRAADAGWATEKLRERLVGDLRLFEYRLPYMLLERFAEGLPPDVVAAAYGYVYAQGQQGGIYIINEDGVEHWKLLLRLDRERALSDIVALHEKGPPADALLSLLIKRTDAPDERVARAAARWLSDVYRPGGQFRNVPLHVLMLKASPDAHLPTIVGRVHKLVGVSQRHHLDAPAGPGEVETLIAAMTDINPSHIRNAHTRAMRESALATYAGRRADIKDAVEFAGTLESGKTFRAEIAYDRNLRGWRPVPTIRLPHHHSARVEWLNLEDFSRLNDPKSRRKKHRVVFKVVSEEVVNMSSPERRRWNTTYRCRILRVESSR